MHLSLTLLALLLSASSLRAQGCEPIKLATDAQKRGVLRDYISTCYQRHFLSKNKGAVKLIAYQDAEGRPCWLLNTLVDDQYRTAPPAHYARLGNDVILVYQGDSQGNALSAADNVAARVACLRKVLGSRVYHYTEEDPQYTLDTSAPDGPKKIKITHFSGGSSHNDLLIKFNKDGTVTKFKPV